MEELVKEHFVDELLSIRWIKFYVIIFKIEICVKKICQVTLGKVFIKFQKNHKDEKN